MGVIRRENDWRLEKKENGVYLITYKKEPKEKIITNDYSSDDILNEREDLTIPVTEVNEFSDVKQIFNTKNTNKKDTNLITESNNYEDDTDIPPAAIILSGFIGTYLIYQSGLNYTSYLFLIGSFLIVLSFIVIGLSYHIYRTKGIDEMFEFLFKTEEETDNTTNNDNKKSKTPPAPQKLKDKIYFERANQNCEWCEKRTDSPEIHHIKPRSEQGPNTETNLICLCPGCHSKADKGGISRTKLQSKVKRQIR